MKYLINIFLFYTQVIFAQDTINTELYNYANKYKDMQNLSYLVNILIKPTKTDNEKIEIFYYWISQNISYDIKKGWYIKIGANQSLKSTEEILTSKIAICSEYSKLFKAMCDKSEIKCYVISGYCKVKDFATGNFRIGLHSWNIVFIDGEWKIIDATWGSGYVTSENNYIQKINLKYLYAKPEVFIETHFPEDPMCQLLNEPISLLEFYNSLPYINKKKSLINYNFNDTIAKSEKLDYFKRYTLMYENRIIINEDYPLHISSLYKDVGLHLLEFLRQPIEEYEKGLFYIEKAFEINKDSLMLEEGYYRYANNIWNILDHNCENLQKMLIYSLKSKEIFNQLKKDEYLSQKYYRIKLLENIEQELIEKKCN